MKRALIKFCQRRWRVRLLAGSYVKFTETAPAVKVRALCHLCGEHTAQALTASLAEGLALKDWCFLKSDEAIGMDFSKWYAPLKNSYELEASKVWRKMPAPQLVQTIDTVIENEIGVW